MTTQRRSSTFHKERKQMNRWKEKLLLEQKEIEEKLKLQKLQKQKQKKESKDSDEENDNDTVVFDYSQYRNPKILEQNCSITILYMEPKFGNLDYKSNDSTWTNIESVVSNLHDDILDTVCILIQTSVCEQTKRKKKGSFHQNIQEYLLKNAHKVFRKLVENGNVRFTILDHQKYKLKSCSNFWNPSFAWMNYEYWTSREFVAQDSDFIMISQTDVLMCNAPSNLNSYYNLDDGKQDQANDIIIHNDTQQQQQQLTKKHIKQFHPDNWHDIAYVGAVWNKHFEPKRGQRDPLVNVCDYYSKVWNIWHSKYLDKMKKKNPQDTQHFDKNEDNENDRVYYERYFNNITNPFLRKDWCDGKSGIAPLGNGGFSLRSRKWMRDAIEFCPSEQYSGFSKETLSNKRCIVPRGLLPNEDVYFGVVLRGMNAPLPNAFEASLFSTEQTFPEGALKMYYNYTTIANNVSNKSNEEFESKLEDMVKKRWGEDSLEYYRQMRRTDPIHNRIISLGFHKPKVYHHKKMDEAIKKIYTAEEFCPKLNLYWRNSNNKNPGPLASPPFSAVLKNQPLKMNKYQ